MLRTLTLVVTLAAATVAARAQGPDMARFGTEFQRAFELKDDKALDKLLRSTNDMPAAAMDYFESLRADVWSGKTELQPKVDMIKAAWARVFENSPVLERLERWIESQDQRTFQAYRRVQKNVETAWRHYSDELGRGNTDRKMYEQSRTLMMEAAQQMEATGHKVQAAEAWKFVAIMLYRIPDKTTQDRRDAVFALEQFVSMRQAWEWTQDQYYVINQNTLKAEKVQLDLKAKEDEKRKGEGYGENVKGIDALAMPGVAEKQEPLAFELMGEYDAELDYCQRGGPLPVYWWVSSFGKDTKDTRLAWFRSQDLSLIRLGTTKFGVSTMPSDEKRTQEVEVSGKGKPSKFFLDADHKVAYGMYFWIGGDKERVGEADVNLAPADVNTPVYYRSAASWTTTVGGEQLTLYDDNTSGKPGDAEPFSGEFKMHTLGFPEKTADNAEDPRIKAPLLDSMRVGKGPRGPFSEFVRIGTGWHYVHLVGDKIGSRPLNSDYLKLGKVKLLWTGPKPTAPAQLVILGRGDFKTAAFDIASGKEVEVPGGEYQVIWGRIVAGKGARMQMGTLYSGDCKAFTVEAGKTYELRMGGPFTLDFERKGNATDVEVDGTHIWLREDSGCAIAELHGMCLAPELLASKMIDGKGAKPIGRFQRLTDSELLNKAAEKLPGIGLMAALLSIPDGSKDGSMVLKVKLPAAGMKVALSMKKHPLFGKLDSTWR